MGDGLKHPEGGIPLAVLHVVHVGRADAHAMGYMLVSPTPLDAQLGNHGPESSLRSVTLAIQSIADFACHGSDNQLLTIRYALVYSCDDYPGLTLPSKPMIVEMG